MDALNQLPAKGIFLTGIESSDPWVEGKRRNQLREARDFYTHQEERLANIAQAGITWLRFGPPYSDAHPAQNVYNFALMDRVAAACDAKGITIIADLLHFGLPTWLHASNPAMPFFQNPTFPEHFAAYAAAFAKRYPAIRHYTVVNEPFITGVFSAKYGMWNEALRSPWHDDRDFVRAIMHIARAAVLAREAILAVWSQEQRPGNPIFVQNESFELAMADDIEAEGEVLRFNLRRFAALDLIFGRDDPLMRDYLLSQGMGPQEYDWFMAHGSREHTILGIDHYPGCVHHYGKNGNRNAGPHDPHMLGEVVRQYAARYPMPLLHTEVNAWPQHATDACQKTYDALLALKNEGYPVLGMGWYGDEYQMGWHHALCGSRSLREESPVGLFHKGELQPVGKLFSAMAREGFVTSVMQPVITQ